MKKVLSFLLVLVLCLSMVSIVGAEGKTIVYWSMWNSTEPQGIAIQAAVDAYMAASGNTVDLQFKGRNGIREGLEPALASKTTIDLFDEDIDRVSKTWNQYLMNLEDMAKAANYEATANAGLMAACRDSAGGQLMSIPYQPFVFNFFYNPEIFEKAGVTAVPTTWAEFLDVCQKIKDAGFIPITCDDAYIDCLLGYHMSRYLGAEGTGKVVKEGLWAEEPAVLKVAQDYENLAKSGFFSPTIASSAWPTNQNGEFALEGAAAMYLNGSWLPNEVREMVEPGFVFGCFAYPAVDGGKTGVEAANFGSQAYGINKDSQVGQEAFDLICTITKGQFDAQLAKDSLGIPADSSNTEWAPEMAGVKPVMDGITTRFPWAAGIQDNADMTPIIVENFKKLCGGTITAQEFVDTLEAAGK